MKKLDVRLTTSETTSRPVGTLAESGRRLYFGASPELLHSKLQLSPFRLPAAPGLIEHVDRAFGPLPGLFDDSLPDGWGLLLMDRQYRKLGVDPATVSVLDRLAWLGTSTMGALTYHPPAERDAAPAAFDLQVLAANAREILAGETAEILPQLLRAGGSPGGARPKVLIGLRGDECVSGADELPEGYEHWMVKFPARADDEDAGAVEYAYSLMARAAGLDLPATRLLVTADGSRFFAVRRFDRTAGKRVHVHSFGNLIHANFRIPSCDYSHLFRVTGALTRDHRQALRVLRLLAFNVLAHNRDDHVKNFAFLMNDITGEWSLSPAYDLNFAAGPGGEHSMTVAGAGKSPGRVDILKLCGTAGIAARDADAVIAEVRAAVARWPSTAAQAGVSRSRAAQVAGSLGGLG